MDPAEDRAVTVATADQLAAPGPAQALLEVGELVAALLEVALATGTAILATVATEGAITTAPVLALVTMAATTDKATVQATAAAAVEMVEDTDDR